MESIISPWLYTYSLTGNFLTPIFASDWLKFCCGNLILNQKKRNKNDKTFILNSPY